MCTTVLIRKHTNLEISNLDMFLLKIFEINYSQWKRILITILESASMEWHCIHSIHDIVYLVNKRSLSASTIFYTVTVESKVQRWYCLVINNVLTWTVSPFYLFLLVQTSTYRNFVSLFLLITSKAKNQLKHNWTYNLWRNCRK